MKNYKEIVNLVGVIGLSVGISNSHPKIDLAIEKLDLIQKNLPENHKEQEKECIYEAIEKLLLLEIE